jgi:hypothetical protein
MEFFREKIRRFSPLPWEKQSPRSKGIGFRRIGTGGSIFRKGAEFTRVPVAEFVPWQAEHSRDLP